MNVDPQYPDPSCKPGGSEMCEVYVKADPMLYECRSRAIRIRGVMTSIRLENLFWDTLAKMAAEHRLTTNQLIVQFHDEIEQQRGEVLNFTSFLRVTCLRFLKLSTEGAKHPLDRVALPTVPDLRARVTTH
jgi:predicted DNA-binding ribbon-helix-helix protein